MEVEPKVEPMLRLFFRKVEYKGYFIGGAGLFFSMGKKNSAFRDQRSGTAVHSCPRTVTGNRAFSVTYRKIHPSFPPPFFRFSINFTQTTLIKNRPKANNVVTPGYTLNPEKDKKKNHSNGCCLFSLRNSLLLEDTFTHPSSDGKWQKQSRE